MNHSSWKWHWCLWPMLAVALACGAGTTAQQVRILDLPQFICPSSTPRPTHTALPTQVQPPIYIPPSGYATFTPVPGCLWNGRVCATNTPASGGLYQQPGYTLTGAISTPRPTFTPWPTPTPLVTTGPFHLGADVYTGGFASAVSLRLRIESVAVIPFSADRQIVTWGIELENIGTVSYVTIPGGQVFVAALRTSASERAGQWWASAEAARAAAIPPESRISDALTVAPDETYRFTLAAYTPLGEPLRLGWALDPLSGGQDHHLTGGNVAYWSVAAQTECVGNLGSDAVIPTLQRLIPTATPTARPTFPPWCVWCP